MAMNNRNLETQKFEIEKPYVIICEGKDDFAFLGEYLNYLDKLKLIDKKLFKIIQVKGVDNIAKEMKNYKNYSDYDAMKGFLFVRVLMIQEITERERLRIFARKFLIFPMALLKLFCFWLMSI